MRLASSLTPRASQDASWLSAFAALPLLVVALFAAPMARAQSLSGNITPNSNTQINKSIAVAEKFSLNSPSQMTSRALFGIFTSVTRAGSRLVAVGEQGRVIISNDNGRSWHQVETPTSVTLTHVAFATATDGWAVGGMGLVMHSTDGGLTWTKQFDGTQSGNVALTAAQADIKKFGSDATRMVNLQLAQQMIAAGPTVPFLDVYASSPSNVMVAGAFGMAFSSIDAGRSWRSLADFLPDPSGLHIYQIMQDGVNFAVAGEQGFALYGLPGKALTTITTPFQGTFFGEIFAPDHSWLLFGLQGIVLRSQDRGEHWDVIPAGAQVGIDCGAVLKDGTVLLGNLAGQLLISHDNGKKFSVIVEKGPVIGLTQAADGAVIIVGPAGPKRISFDKLVPGA